MPFPEVFFAENEVVFVLCLRVEMLSHTEKYMHTVVPCTTIKQANFAIRCRFVEMTLNNLLNYLNFFMFAQWFWSAWIFKLAGLWVVVQKRTVWFHLIRNLEIN